MATRFRPGGWAIAAAIAFAIALTLEFSGALRRWDELLVETYSRWSSHEDASDLVVIGIDSQSLAELNSWPWPRGTHARLLDFLRHASPARVFLDIDFSSTSTAEEDRVLAVALSRWDRNRLVMPVFVQAASGNDVALRLTRPLPAFAASATLGSVNLAPDPDSSVRRIQSAWQVDGATVPSVFTLLAGVEPAQGIVIDYSISPSSFAYYPYVDVLRGQVPLEALRGKTILIGATALELGDMQPVPVYRTLPGVVIHALATQTARTGAVQPTPFAIALLVVAAWALLLAWLMGRMRWSASIVVTAAAVLGAIGMGYAAWLLRRRFDAAPLVLAAGADFVAVTLWSLDVATLRTKLLTRLANRRAVLLDSVFDSSYDGILCVDAAGIVAVANTAARTMLAGTPTQILGRSLGEFVSDIDVTPGSGSLEAMNGRILERTVSTCDGRILPVEVSTMVAAHEEGRQYTLILRDLSERRQQEARQRYQATHDQLTGLPNRVHLLERLEVSIVQAGTQSLAVLVLNLTRFKEVNDTLGHSAGDIVLCQSAGRLRAVMAGRGFMARMDGDEFAVIAGFDGERGAIDALGRDLTEALREPMVVEGVPVGVGVSIGAACYPVDGDNPTALMKHADIAMYTAKRLGDRLAFYDASQNEHSLRRLALLGELRAAMDADELELHYQPQICLATSRVEGVEALLRWNHALYGFISPGELVPLIERTDMLRPLTDWTIGRALAQQLTWARQGVDVRVAVNLSARILQDLTFPDRLAALLATHPVRPELELEITESATLLHVDRALAVGKRIRELGVQLSVDDYGTGHSSLAYLRDLSVSVLKLDRTFVENLESRPDNQAIVESTLALAHALGLSVIAEGVSSAWQVDYLRRLGYDSGQGYFFAKPMEASRCLRWIRERNGQEQARVEVA